jgi:hypothetical protein
MDDMLEQSRSLDISYSKAFKGNQDVLDDMSEFCNEKRNAFNEDARREAFILGMQNVITYIRSRIAGDITKDIESMESDIIGDDYDG